MQIVKAISAAREHVPPDARQILPEPRKIPPASPASAPAADSDSPTTPSAMQSASADGRASAADESSPSALPTAPANVLSTVSVAAASGMDIEPVQSAVQSPQAAAGPSQAAEAAASVAGADTIDPAPSPAAPASHAAERIAEPEPEPVLLSSGPRKRRVKVKQPQVASSGGGIAAAFANSVMLHSPGARGATSESQQNSASPNQVQIGTDPQHPETPTRGVSGAAASEPVSARDIAASFKAPFVHAHDTPQASAQHAQAGAAYSARHDEPSSRQHGAADVRAAADALHVSNGVKAGPCADARLASDAHIKAEDDDVIPLSTRERYSNANARPAKRMRMPSPEDDGDQLGDVTTIELQSSSQRGGRSGWGRDSNARGRGGRGGRGGGGGARGGGRHKKHAHANEDLPDFDYEAELDRKRHESKRWSNSNSARGSREGGRGGRRGGKRAGIMDGRAEGSFNPFAVEQADFDAPARNSSARSGNKSEVL